MVLNLIFGFLGSGKTTLVCRLLRTPLPAGRFAVIVNEFGDVGIDGQILRGRDIDMVELNSGCLCCTLKGSLLMAIEELRAKGNIQRIVIEATGIAQPGDLLQTLEDPGRTAAYDIGPLITVVDAAGFRKIRAILGPFYIDQIAHADVVLLNKTDLASAGELEAVRSEVTALNPHAAVLLTQECDVAPELILDGSRAERRIDPGSKDPHRHAPANTVVLDAGGDWEPHRLERFFSQLPDSVWRAKGFMHVGGKPHQVQYTMGRLTLTPDEQRPHEHLVFIGGHLDAQSLRSRFASARAPAAKARAG